MARLGANSTTRVAVAGLADFQRDLRAVDAKLPRELAKGLKEAAEPVAERARSLARAAGGAISHQPVVDSIKAAAEQRYAKIVWGGARAPMADGAIMGALQYRQFRGWVGNDWEVGVAGQGPYAVNDAVAQSEAELIESIGDLVERVSAQAFPSGR